MDKRILLVLFLLLGSVLVTAYMRGNFSSRAVASGTRVTIGSAQFMVEVADTIPLQSKGLSGHAPLAADSGMLFIFDGARIQTFWMKGMLFPIDIIWIRDGRVIGFAQNAPADTTFVPAMYNSPEPADMVLEVNAGTVARVGITIGASVTVTR